jgi:hypothetical protein
LIADLILVDKIAAVVNEEIITYTDIDKYIQFFPIFKKTSETETEFYQRALQDLINYKAVHLEYRDHFVVNQEDFINVQTSIINKVGSYSKLLNLLKDYDMEWEDFKAFIGEKVIYDHVVEKNFQIKINISFNDIEDFYKNQYLPLQKSLELKPKSLIEMAPSIENQLRKDRLEVRLAQWLKEIMSSYNIENKLLQETE